MNARIPLSVQSSEPAGTADRTTFVWESSFGRVLIEIVGEQVFVNGDKVEPAAENTVASTKQGGQ